jgi:hypothetical protein
MTHSDYLHPQERLQEYWASLKGDRIFPSEADIDQDAIADIWASCFLISIDDVTRRLGYRYSYLGSEFANACGEDIHNPNAALQLLSSGTIPIMRKVNAVLAERKPMMDKAQFTNLKHQMIEYQACMLPLGYNDTEVSHILGCICWRVAC